MPRAFTIRILLAIVALSTFGFALSRRADGGFRHAYATGRAEAEKELASGQATMYTYGLRLGDGPGSNVLERTSGLPFKAIAGCLVDEVIRGRAEGHNDRILEAINAGNPPANSLKPWMALLDDLPNTFATLTLTSPSTPLKAGGGCLGSPDGSLKVRAVAAVREPGTGKVVEGPGLILEGTFGTRKLESPWREGESEIVWEPGTSGLGFVRMRHPQGGGMILALDSKGGQWVARASIDASGKASHDAGDFLSADEY